MNVTLKLPEDLCRKAKHRAVDESKSLSQWMTDLLRMELAKTQDTTGKPHQWMDAFSGDEDDEFLSRDFPLPDRKALKEREIYFED